LQASLLKGKNHATCDQMNGSARSMITWLRSLVADAFGIRDPQAKRGGWWEIDLILVIMLGSIALGAWAFTQL
jgi:hypothetical protein